MKFFFENVGLGSWSISKILDRKYSYFVGRENILSGAGRKVRFYTTNEELPHQIFKEASVHSITQDCSSNKTKITKQKKIAPVPTPPLLWPTELLLLLEPWWRHSELASMHPNTAVCSYYPFIVGLVISPTFRFWNFDGFGFLDINHLLWYGFCCILVPWCILIGFQSS